MTQITQTSSDTIPKTSGQIARHILVEIALMLLVIVVVSAITRTAVENVAVRGVSMAPTLHATERVLVNKVAYWFNPPQRGDVVIAGEPEYQATVVKRIIGLPGDELVIEGGEAFLNGHLLHEPYLPPADFIPAPVYRIPTSADITNGDGRWLVPDGHYFLLGDDRNFSADSRAFGPVAADAIRGKVQLLIWPPARWRVVAHHPDDGVASN